MTKRTRLGALMAGAALAGAVALVTPVPAHADPSASSESWVVNTTQGSCATTGPTSAKEVRGGCFLDDRFDNTLFQWDAGGRAAKLHHFSNYLGHIKSHYKVEFHPYGEWLWIYDVNRDGRSAYVEVKYAGRTKVYATPSAANSPRQVNLAIDEGTAVTITLYDRYDENGGRDKLGSVTGIA